LRIIWKKYIQQTKQLSEYSVIL